MSQTAVVLVLNLLLGSATNHIDVVIAWNVAALSAVRAEKTQPPVAARALAILHVSIYDAINGVERSFEPYLASESVPQRASKEARPQWPRTTFW
jgi:succinate dehydrogenase hydrophobic anchor subunit